MVADTGATPSPGGIRPLDAPQLVRVDLGDGDMPARVCLKPVLSPNAPVRRRRQMKIDCAMTGGSTSPTSSRLSTFGRSSPRVGTTPVRHFDKLRACTELVEGSPYFESSEIEGLRAVLSKGRWRQVLEVLDSWRIDDEWWRKEPVSRLYYRVLLEDGTMTGLFKDLVSSDWYSQRV